MIENVWFARDICMGLEGANAKLIESAFSINKRENYLLPPPWQITVTKNGRSRTISTRDVNDIYHDNVISIDDDLSINNGKPSMWAYIFWWSGVSSGDSVYHSGAGLGYYTAILSDIVGVNGTVIFDEANSNLQEKCISNLANKKNTILHIKDGQYSHIFLSYGLRKLGARLLSQIQSGALCFLPFTNHKGRGYFLKICMSPDKQYLLIEVGMPVFFITDVNYNKNEVSDMPLLDVKLIKVRNETMRRMLHRDGLDIYELLTEVIRKQANTSI